MRGSIKNRILIWFLLVTLFTLFSALTVVYFRQVRIIEEGTFEKLSAIRDLKIDRLRGWLQERDGDMKNLSENKKLTDLEVGIYLPDNSPEKEQIYLSSLEILESYTHSYPAYRDMFILHPKTGEVVISSNSLLIGEDYSTRDFFRKTAGTGDFFQGSIYYDEDIHDYTMVYSAPLFCTQHPERHLIGILGAQIDLNNSLYRLIHDYAGLGDTGETLIVDSSHQALNKLRYSSKEPLGVHINAEPAVRGAAGETGILIAPDYRGVKVLAAYSHIPEVGWGFVSKQDLSELNAPIRQMLWNFLLIFAIALFVVFILSRQISKSISEPILQMNKVAIRFGEGDLSARNQIRGVGDELDSLAREFNKLAAAVSGRIKVQEFSGSISKAIIGKDSSYEFAHGILKALITASDANSAAFYVYDRESDSFHFLSGIGINPSKMPSFRGNPPEGEVGIITATGKIQHIKNIPEDTPYSFLTTSGELIPREMITIPVKVLSETRAFISLATIHKFNDDFLEALNLAKNSIDTGYSNLLSMENTRKLAQELAESNRKLDEQAGDLRDKSEELEKQTIELKRASEELQEQNYELDRQRREVEEANQLKSEFLSNMSHELRTPLNSIMALSKVLIIQANNKLNEDENNYLTIIERNGKRLLGLINNILDLSKIESGRMDFNPQEFSIKELIETTVESLRSLADEKGIELSSALEEDIPRIKSDESRLHQVLVNVIGNAIKFTDKGGVRVSCQKIGNKLEIEVQDTGIGIDEDVLPHIFDEFRQADGSSSRQYEGTGLGLAIASRLTQLLGGQISVRSEKSKGSTFRLEFPLTWERPGTVFPSFKTGRLFRESKSRKILVVDDNRKVAQSIADLVRAEGFEAVIARSGEEALKWVKKTDFFAITLDVLMPDMDGWEVLKELKANTETQHVPVVMISVSDDKDTGYALGAVGFMNKPVEKSELISELRKLETMPSSVLIVDDDPIILDETGRVLTAEGINILRANNGRDGLKILERDIPDLVILDLMMPGMDGFEVLEKLKSNPETKKLPVIIMTAKNLSHEEEKTLRGNTSVIITKDSEKNTKLITEVQRLLKQLKSSDVELSGEKKQTAKNLLIVEDNPDAVVQIRYLLEQENYTVRVAGNGKEAVDLVNESLPDGIILDLMMPEMDGFEVLNQIRSSEETRNIPILILTAKDLGKEDFKKLSDNNVQQLIHKGDVSTEELLFKTRLMLGNTSGAHIEKIKLSTGSDDEQKDIEEIHKTKKRKFSAENSSERKILIVEDNPDNMISLKAILQNKYRIIEAMDGLKGIEMMHSERPDVLLLDMNLPGKSGKEIVRELKQDPHTRDIPVVAVTAQAMKGDKEEFLKAGCDFYISKPVDPDELMKIIKPLMKS